jgi:hypothetical protein
MIFPCSVGHHLERGFNILTALLWLPSGWNQMANGISRTRTSFPSTEMAHRQSGGYKEEPGVAVAGDHVSVQLFNLMAVTHSAGFGYRVCALQCSTCNTRNNFFASAIIQSPQLRVFASPSALVWRQGMRQGWAWRCGFDAFQKITSGTRKCRAKFVGSFHNRPACMH